MNKNQGIAQVVFCFIVLLYTINTYAVDIHDEFDSEDGVFITSNRESWSISDGRLFFQNLNGKAGFVNPILTDPQQNINYMAENFYAAVFASFEGGDQGYVYGLQAFCIDPESGNITDDTRIAVTPGIYRIDKRNGTGGVIVDWTQSSLVKGDMDILQIDRNNDTLYFYINNQQVATENLELCPLMLLGLFSSENVESSFDHFQIYPGTISSLTSTLNEEEPVVVATPEVYVNTNSQNIFKDEALQVFFNTSVLAGMSEQYDVYFSINWDDVTLYDNGVDLVTDKQPLFNNIVVPELSNWFEYEKLRYTFPEGVPQTDYVLGLHLVDNEDNLVFESFSSVSYFPEQSPFISSGDSKQQSRGRVTNSKTRQAKSSSKKCHLGGIRTDVENTAATELDKATKRSMLALQMGSSFPLEGRLKTIYQGVKGSYNLLKKGKKVCDNVNKFETLFDNYDDNIDFSLSNEQASNIFAIEMLTSALSLTSGGGVLYSGFDSNDLVNGIKDYYNNQNKQFSAISSLDNSATIKIKFDQPFHWFQFATKAVKLKVTATPVFTYADNNEFTALKDVPKNFTNSGNIKSIDLGEADSDRTSFGNIDYILSTTLTRGLYLIKASTVSGDEVFRDTIHVIREGQEHTMVIDR